MFDLPHQCHRLLLLSEDGELQVICQKREMGEKSKNMLELKAIKGGIKMVWIDHFLIKLVSLIK